MRKSWATKEKEKAKLLAIRTRERELKDSIRAEKEAKNARQKEARERREANAKKSEVVQVIRDSNKIKKMSRKQLKFLRKAAIDTN